MTPLLILVTPLLVCFPDQPADIDPVKMLQGSRQERLNALGWLIRKTSTPAANHAFAAVERCVRNDPDDEVRLRAVEVLAMTALQREPRVCPLALVEALLDKDSDVRGIAMGCSSMFKSFPPGTIDILLKGTTSEHATVRGNVLILMPIADKKDARVDKAVRAALADPSFDVRSDAHIGLYRLTDRPADVVPYWLQFITQDWDKGEPQSPEAKEERSRWNLRRLGGAIFLRELARERPKDMADCLLDLLGGRSAPLRARAAQYLGALAQNTDLDQPPLAPRIFLIPSDEPPPEPKKVGEKKVPQVLQLLRERDVEKRLEELRTGDADDSVRRLAEAALEKLRALPRK